MKFNNKKKEVHGILFDSIMESNYYLHLLEEKEAGLITDIQLQPVYLLLPSFRKLGKVVRKMEYKADFLVTYADGTQIAIDVKGALTDAFKLKAKLFDYYFPDLELRLVREYKGQWVQLRDIPKPAKKGRVKGGGAKKRKIPRRNTRKNI